MPRSDLPASRSKHFSCNLPFFGIASKILSLRLSTKKLMVLFTPKRDLEACSLDMVCPVYGGDTESIEDR